MSAWQLYRVTVALSAPATRSLASELESVTRDEPIRTRMAHDGQLALVGTCSVSSTLELFFAAAPERIETIGALAASGIADPLMTRLRWALEACGEHGARLAIETRDVLDETVAWDRYGWSFEGEPNLHFALRVRPELDHDRTNALSAFLRRLAREFGYPNAEVPAPTNGEFTLAAGIRSGDLRCRLTSWFQAWWVPAGTRVTLL